MEKAPRLFSDLRKNKEKINVFLEACSSQHQNKEVHLKDFRDIYRKRLEEAESFFVRFRTDIEKIPFELAIEHWLDFHAASSGIDDACEIFEKLITENVIVLEDSEGEVLTLGHQAILGHSSYIDEIRCLRDIPLRQRERMVSVYLQFSRHLSQATLGFVSAQADPDRLKVEKKTTSYDEFMDFVQYLSERDALIAYLMYFDEPSMTEVIDLKVSGVSIEDCNITFGNHQASYPKHVMQRLQELIKGKTADELVFQNRTKEAVNRSRIYRAFKTASSKMTPPQEITPARLIEKHH